jgi:hypothetical protein
MKLILTIDTEGDNQWEHGRDLRVENIKFVPRFQGLCEKHNIKPVYLVTSEVCEDEFSREIFSDYLNKGKAEIGAHLHSWTTPPFLDKDGYRYNDPKHAYASDLDESILNEKIKYLTAQIESSFGQRPASFRSGRYGFNEKVAKVLAENSYLVDSSVTPYTNWIYNIDVPAGNGGPDFSDKRPFPYLYSFGNYSLAEIPITVLPTRFPLNRNQRLAEFCFKNVGRSIILKGIRKLVYKNQPLWLRPFEWSTLNLFDEILNEASRIKLQYIVMMFHSSELMPGCSQYRPDEESVDRLYDLLESLFDLLHSREISSLTLTEAAKSLNL